MQELLPVILDELKRASDDISQAELDRARAQVRAGLMMSMESPTARAGQIARQLLLFGRQIPNDELMERLNALSIGRIRDLAGRMFHGSDTTLTAIGPVKNIARLNDIGSYLNLKPANVAE